jgi:hypothetical protein
MLMSFQTISSIYCECLKWPEKRICPFDEFIRQIILKINVV